MAMVRVENKKVKTTKGIRNLAEMRTDRNVHDRMIVAFSVKKRLYNQNIQREQRDDGFLTDLWY